MISIVMAYAKRPEHLRVTLESYKHHYTGEDIEICIIEDTPAPNDNDCQKLLEHCGFPYAYKAVDRSNKKYRNPGVLYNMAVDMAAGEYIHITNPENLHYGPILIHCKNHIKDDNYIVYGCRTLRCQPPTFQAALEDIDHVTNWEEAQGWYQHSTIYNRLLHFASIMNKDLYKMIGGFDPRYDDGIGYEDNDFIRRVKYNNIKVLTFDEPFAAHQSHDRGHWNNNTDGFSINSALYQEIWGENTIEHWPK